ncbi:MAG: PspC domain-containing protein [Clostridiales bacterium]|nr:PspC domain-containing protein [Clostridiales bacterium]
MDNEYRKLVRSRDNRKICGICGGIGEYLSVDPTVVRIIWVVCTLASVGTGAVAYLIAALLIPEETWR